mmetsp:Transcript_47838/g.104105  ORF Transcript_47838/g.104105 Transcript_47838/m.104105 type:complete len:242 (-) Transcript_47838:272-997(-)
MVVLEPRLEQLGYVVRHGVDFLAPGISAHQHLLLQLADCPYDGFKLRFQGGIIKMVWHRLLETLQLVLEIPIVKILHTPQLVVQAAHSVLQFAMQLLLAGVQFGLHLPGCLLLLGLHVFVHLPQVLLRVVPQLIRNGALVAVQAISQVVTHLLLGRRQGRLHPVLMPVQRLPHSLLRLRRRSHRLLRGPLRPLNHLLPLVVELSPPRVQPRLHVGAKVSGGGPKSVVDLGEVGVEATGGGS